MSSSSGSQQQVRVKVLFFAQARELAGVSESELLLPARLASNDLKGRLISEFHLSLIGGVFVVALNESFVEEDTHLELRESDEIAVIPPLSGGAFYDLLLVAFRMCYE
ncbi:unnamed protein product [Trichogramma brassicae]|uniref:Molybdopterin synthase sulfur carrier subunit n=1 Tax=Trichogramma brassicae TaxID=86971 RepID=A0A6H5IH83_9HYME|nr:unnamed protein product [Trichogramma brassicae]